MEFVKFDLKDKEQLVALERECFGGESDRWDDGVWGEIFGDPIHNIIYLAMEDKVIASFAAIYNWGSERNYVKITNVGTKGSFRGRGLVHKLFEMMIDEMKSEGMTEFKAETRATNYAMQKIFDDFGFKKVGIMQGYYETPDEDAFVYWLSI